MLTLAYDSEKDLRGVMFRDIQPDAFYPVYGDSSLRSFDAQSSGRFYLRVERGRSYLLYGDLLTLGVGYEGQGLGTYSRSLTGLQEHFETRRLMVNAFASHDSLRQVIDEIPGLGISGPYAVSNPNGISFSEKVEIVTRDRNQPSLVLDTVRLTRYTDYEFEPFSGRLLFKRPVPSLDERLNPVSIRVTYEVDHGGEKSWVGGVDGRVKLGSRVQVGASWVEDTTAAAPYRLWSANSLFELGKSTTLVGEAAHTSGTINTNAFNQTAFANLAFQSGDVEGSAARVELRHQSSRLAARAFAGTSDPGFNNPASTLTGGRTEGGGRATLTLGKRLQLIGEGLFSEDRVTGGARQGGVVALEGQMAKTLRFEVGLRRARESQGAAQTTSPGLLPLTLSGSRYGFGFGSTNSQIDPVTGTPVVNPGMSPLLGSGAGSESQTGLIDVLTLRAKLAAEIGKRSELYAEGEQDIRDSEKRLAAFGGNVRLSERTRLYARHEFISSLEGPYALNSRQRSYSTVFGLSSSYLKSGEVFNEYRMRDAIAGREAVAAIGLRNLWTPAEGVRLSTGLERLHAIAGSDQTATAASLGMEYTRNPRLKGAGRIEWRRDGAADSWLSTIGLGHKMSRSWTLLGKNYYERMSPRTSAPDHVQDRLSVGAAYRDTDTNRVNLLSRYEFRFEDTLGLLQGADTRRKVHIVSTHADWHPARAWQLSGQYAAKKVDDRTDPAASQFLAHLWSGRAGYDLTKRWDLGALASLMWSPDGGRRYALGGEAGYLLRDNLWLSAGYNATGFSDRDMVASNSTSKGLFVRLRMKLDEDLCCRKDQAGSK